MSTWRLIPLEEGAGDWNMAVDAALMESVAARGECCLRFYSWSQPTLSLGYFQSLASRQSHPASLACPIVRRATGGGAILHDRELTYSFIAPANHPLVAKTLDVYQLLHGSLIDVLAAWGLAANLCASPRPVAPADEPFLCFQRRAAGDVLLGTAKICGSAQRRRSGAVLQHGSVLISRSLAAPELFGIADLGGSRIPATELAAAWAEDLARRCGIQWHSEPLEPAEVVRAGQHVDETYGAASWTARR